MDNPYSPPQSDVEVINTSNLVNHFKRFSAWWVFLLTGITFGLYTIYWLYTRSVTINSVHHHRIRDEVIWLSILTYLVSTALSFIPESAIPNHALFGLLATIAYLFFFLWWLFAVRNRLQEMFAESGRPDSILGPVMTFLFQAIYLQYKINEQIDQQTLAEPVETEIQESATY